MPSERRLHPLSFLFGIAGQLRQFLVPGLLLIFTASATTGRWERWMVIAVVPAAAGALVRSLSYRYRLDETELVVRTGFVFRKERHIPYARIQNIEGIQNVVHRLLNVIEVRIETGAGKEDDATMRVVPVAAYDEIRECVHGSRPAAVAAEPPDAGRVEPSGAVVLRLPARELLLSGLIDNRAAVMIAAALGLVWELGLFDRAFNFFFEDETSGRGVVRRTIASFANGGPPRWQTLLLSIAALLTLYLFVTALSMLWACVRLQGFVLRRAGDDLRVEFGLFTRISTTIPIRRIQTLTVFEGPLHRLFGRAAVKVETAGADAKEQGATGREPLAPIIRQRELDGLLDSVLPGVHPAALEWQPASPRAFGRVLRRSSAGAAVASVVVVLAVRWLAGGFRGASPGPGTSLVWMAALLAILLAIATVHARRYTASLGWAARDGAVWFRRGWLWRRTTVTRFSKIQTVALHRSPFDRRTNMARLRIDTAGAAHEADRIDMPYLPVDVAGDLHRRLALEASGTHFQW